MSYVNRLFKLDRVFPHLRKDRFAITQTIVLLAGERPLKKILVLYATREGQTHKIADRIAQHLSLDNSQVQLLNAREVELTAQLDLESFDLLIFGASMHAGGLEPEIIKFVNQHRQIIAQQQRSFFLVLLSAATKDDQLRSTWLADALKKMKQQIQVEFQDIELIAGALQYSKYPLPLKWVMKRIAQQAGEGTDFSQDYEYTDWEQVKAYADRLGAIA